ncbi:LytR/AlgR family response regulator transcription factor [Thomasclavelia sp.]
MKIAIIEDLEIDQEILITKINTYFNNSKIDYQLYRYKNAETFLADFKPAYFEIIFMDIYMDDINGMEAAKRVYELDKKCKIIFLTTSKEFAIESYSVHATYYLVKPINDDDFIQAMEFCQLQPKYDVPFLKVTTARIETRLNTNDILYIDIANRVTRIHLINETIKVSGSFKEITEPLLKDSRFINCIRGIVINMEHIIKQIDSFFILDNNEKIPINIRNKKSIEKTYRNYIFERMAER